MFDKIASQWIAVHRLGCFQLALQYGRLDLFYYFVIFCSQSPISVSSFNALTAYASPVS